MHPHQVGPYVIVSRLGHGGMGAVYEAVEQAGGTAVALKLLASHLTDDAGVRGRFVQEIETLKALRHPGIVQLLAYGEDDGQPYFAMELVRGQPLDKLLRGGRSFTWQETITLAGAVARALKVAHDSGAVHRDLKPANLLLPDGGALADVKLADFGIAKFFGGSGHTAAGNVVGTAEYMAPEQAAGKPVDARADIYSLGLVMFAMLTGKPPFRAGHFTEVMRMQQTATPPQLTSLLPSLPQPVDALIQRMLAKNPAERPASALALTRLLSSLEGEIAAEAESRRPLVVDELGDPRLTIRGVKPEDATMEVTTDQPASPADQPLIAPTKGATAPPPPAAATKRDAATKQPTEPDRGPAESTLAGRSRHISVEREQVIAEAREKKTRHRERRLEIASAFGVLAFLTLGSYLLFRPPSADVLYARIHSTVAASDEPLDALKDAERWIDEFQRRHPGDPRAGDVHAMKRTILVDRLGKRAALRERRDKPPYLRIERDYREAMEQGTAAERIAGLKAILVARKEILAAAVGEADADDDLQSDVDLWLDFVKLKIDQVGRLDEADRHAKQQDATRGGS
ncbi:MAG: serine/threonine-protein kinase [Planctomycetia bacterium]